MQTYDRIREKSRNNVFILLKAFPLVDISDNSIKKAGPLGRYPSFFR